MKLNESKLSAKDELLTELDFDANKANERQLLYSTVREICASSDVDKSLLEFAMEECQKDQVDLAKYIERIGYVEGKEVDVDIWTHCWN